MSVICVPDQKRFSAEKFQKVNLFDTERMFCDIYCFEPGQVQKPHAHAENDKIYYVLIAFRERLWAPKFDCLRVYTVEISTHNENLFLN